MELKKYKYEIKWAVIYAVVVLLWFLGERLMGLHGSRIEKQQNYSLFLFIPIILIYLFANIDKKKNFYSGKMSYTQGFLLGIGLTVFILILTPIVQLISSYIISPNYFKNLIEFSIKEGTHSPEQAAKQFTLGNYLFMNLVTEMITGVVFAAFIPIWTKSDKKWS